MEKGFIEKRYPSKLVFEGKSGVSTTIIFIQAIRYIIIVVYRVIKGIRFAFNMLIIVHSLVHHLFRGHSHHLLAIYLNPKQQEEISF